MIVGGHSLRIPFRERALFLAALAVLSLALNLGGIASASTTSRVRVADFAFKPDAIRVILGEFIRWRNVGDHTHTVTSDPAGFFNMTLEPEDAGVRAMRSAGTFRYSCRIHPEMTGVVRAPVVAEPRTGATPGARISITLASARIPGRTYDVQWQRDNGKWRSLRDSVRSRRVYFVPRRTGSFGFRARVHEADRDATSDWSPADFVLVAPPP